ncbi:hypothetical protein WA158_000017 [Blastocystis sp. Blastoise]
MEEQTTLQVKTTHELNDFIDDNIDKLLGTTDELKTRLKSHLENSYLDFPTASRIVMNALMNIHMEIEDCFQKLVDHELHDFSPMPQQLSPDEDTVTFIFQSENQYTIRKSILKHYPNCLLTQLANNPDNYTSEGFIYVDHSDQVFPITKDYIEKVQVDLSVFDREIKYQLHDDFLYLSLPMPMCLYPYHLRELISSRWNAESFSITVNGSRYQIHRKCLERQGIKNSYFDDPPSGRLQYDFQNSSILCDKHLPYFKYIYSYLETGSIELSDEDRAALQLIRRDFKNVKMDNEFIWKICEYNHPIFPYSHILKEEWADILSEWAGTDKKYTLLFRGSRYDFDANAFHKYCDQKGSTFTIVRTITRNKECIFGGFTKVSWTSYVNVVRDPDAYIFTLKNPHDIPPSRFFPNEGELTVEMSPSSLPIFGNYRVTDLALYNHCNRERGGCTDFRGDGAYDNTTTVSNRLFVNSAGMGESNFFKVEELEIYGEIQEEEE